MEARIKNVSTDFTRLLAVKFNHVVKVVTKTETLECSGAVLSQHCEAIGKLIENDDELFLDDYEFAKDFLKILHGGSVKITEKNFEEIIKFGIQFELKNLTELGLTYLTNNISYGKNSQKFIGVCFHASKFAESLGCDFNIDYLWPFEKILRSNITASKRSALVDNIVTAVGIKIVLDMIKVKARAKLLFGDLVNMIDETNASEIIKKFDSYEDCVMYAEALSDFTQDQVLYFTAKLELLALKKEELRILKNFQTCLAEKLEISKPLKLEFNEFDLLLNWGRMKGNELLQLCKFSKTDFYTLEVIMSWVALKRPDWKIVRQLCSLVETSNLPKEYLVHTMRVFKAEGYRVSLDTTKSKGFRVELLNQRFEHELQETMITDKWIGEIRKSIQCGDDISQPHYRHVLFDRETLKPILSGSKISDKELYLIFGRTKNGKQIPFYTDFNAAIRKTDIGYDFITLQYYKKSGWVGVLEY